MHIANVMQHHHSTHYHQKIISIRPEVESAVFLEKRNLASVHFSIQLKAQFLFMRHLTVTADKDDERCAITVIPPIFSFLNLKSFVLFSPFDETIDEKKDD